MATLGIDLSDRIARSVVVDRNGKVLARGTGSPDSMPEADPPVTVTAAGVASASASAAPPISGVSRVTRCLPGAAAVAAEAWVGAARGAKHAICLAIGEQVYAGVLLDGKPWTGAHNRAGAAAWLALNPVERQDYRKFGSLAAEVSSKGIARRLSWRIQAGDHSAVLERAGDLEAITAQHVFEGARTGDGVSISVVRDTAKYIGMAVATLTAAIDPECIVIGGDVAGAADLLLEPVRQECARRLPPDGMSGLRVEFSTLGVDGVAIGAARLAMLASE
jgi:predicted NBD/HSP70 family sugar kinase